MVRPKQHLLGYIGLWLDNLLQIAAADYCSCHQFTAPALYCSSISPAASALHCCTADPALLALHCCTAALRVSVPTWCVRFPSGTEKSSRCPLAGLKTKTARYQLCTITAHGYAHRHAHRPYSLLTAHCALRTAHCPLITAHCPLITAHCPLITAHC